MSPDTMEALAAAKDGHEDPDMRALMARASAAANRIADALSGPRAGGAQASA